MCVCVAGGGGGLQGRMRGQSIVAPACCVLFPPQSSLCPACSPKQCAWLLGRVWGAGLGCSLPVGSVYGGEWFSPLSLSLCFFLFKGGIYPLLGGCSGSGGWHGSLGQVELCTHGREDCFTPCSALIAPAPHQPGCRVSGCPAGTGKASGCRRRGAAGSGRGRPDGARLASSLRLTVLVSQSREQAQ